MDQYHDLRDSLAVKELRKELPQFKMKSNRWAPAQMIAVADEWQVLATKVSNRVEVIGEEIEACFRLGRRFAVFFVQPPEAPIPPAQMPGRLSAKGSSFVALAKIDVPSYGPAFGMYYGDIERGYPTAREAEDRCDRIRGGHERNHWQVVDMYVEP